VAEYLDVRNLNCSKQLSLGCLLACYVLVCLASFLLSLDHSDHHLRFVPQALPKAVGWATLFSVVSFVFLVARFSFGYFISFYFYTVIFGFVVLSWFTDFIYDHETARASAMVSFVAFMLPATFLSVPISRSTLSLSGFELLLNLLLLFCAATAVLGACYNFRFVGLGSIYEFRSTLRYPLPVGYSIGIASSSVLPFLFATFVSQGRRWRILLTLALLLAFYPITLTKMAFFSSIWLLWFALLLRFVGARATIILSLLVPLLIGVVLFAIFSEQARAYFELVNFRMVTTPASLLNVYNDFFARHGPTGFCQVSILNKLLSCPDGPALPETLEKIYGIGYLNASLFATEGVASVGLLFAPAIAFLCGSVVSIGNNVSRELPPRFVLLSSAVLSQYFLNVPLTTVLATHGAALLFLLWYLTPREALRPGADSLQ